MTGTTQIHTYPTLKDSGEALAEQVAEILLHGLASHGRASLAVPGGRTPGPFFDALFSRPLDWSNITLTLTDERWVNSDSADSNQALIDRHRRDCPAMAAPFISLKSAGETCAHGMPELLRRLKALPPLFDAVILGMGDDGHIASIFPGQPWEQDNAPCLPGTAPVPPHQRISLSQSRLLATKSLFFLISGEKKRAILEKGHGLPVHRLITAAHSPIWVYHAEES
jgi:6-phosphogluconolactonase